MQQLLKAVFIVYCSLFRVPGPRLEFNNLLLYYEPRANAEKIKDKRIKIKVELSSLPWSEWHHGKSADYERPVRGATPVAKRDKVQYHNESRRAGTGRDAGGWR